uniref:Putative lipocalin-2 1 n=1 Tax=Ixodes ricinus TaxID=34613 RepID=V5GGX9_IXORI
MKRVICSVVLWCLSVVHVDATSGVIDIDDGQAYRQYQDINKALQHMNVTYWMYYRSYLQDTRDGAEHACVYAIVLGKDGDSYKFEQGYERKMKNGSTEIVKMELYATPYKTDTITTPREVANAMRVHKDKNSSGGAKYKLVYSDDKCRILRLLDGDKLNNCELYIRDSFVDGEVPTFCANMYGNACGRKSIHHSYQRMVYNQSCKKIINKPNEASTKMPTEETTGQEQETTQSSKPPGC